MSARAELQRFIGVDLGGGRGKNTAVARLELSARSSDAPRLAIVEAKVRHGQRGTGPSADEPGGDAHFRDDVLIQWLDRWVDERTVVAIDAPLTLPACVRCRLPCPTVERCVVPVVVWMRDWAPRLRVRGRSDPGKPSVTPYTQRATELWLAGSGVTPREGLGQGHGPLAARATYLRRVLSPKLRLHDNLIEVQPQVTLHRRFGAEAARRAREGERETVWNERKKILQSLGDHIVFDYVWPELVVRNVHVFHAVVSAFTAYLWAREDWSAPGAGAAPASGANAAGESPRLEPLDRSALELRDLWVEDGWIWAPPIARAAGSRRG
ncbi:MAG TPA: hypothetical protein VFG69_04450 [Nannocystaceae bacterium]|nr:hypothetical protein [Nannocystaceae bacterium]